MSSDFGKLSSEILRRCFGDTVRKVGDCLLLSHACTLHAISTSTKLPKKKIQTALAVLIKFNLVTFNAVDFNENIVEYTLHPKQLIYLMRSSRYVYHMHVKYGSIGASIIEEVLYYGSETATNILVKCFSYPENKNEGLEKLRETFLSMVRDNYLIQLPFVSKSSDSKDYKKNIGCNAKKHDNKEEEEEEINIIPKFYIDLSELFTPPEIDLCLIKNIESGIADLDLAQDKDILWKINNDRFHQDFRDELMIDAVYRKLGVSASECFKYILQQMYVNTAAWEKHTSNPISFVNIKSALEKTSKNLDLLRHLDQYLAYLVEDSLGFLVKISDAGGGQYIVQLGKAFEELTLICVEHVVTERFGSKASRIFRIIRKKKYIEQEVLQKEAMIPVKEAKRLSYTLFQEQFIQMKIVRRAGGGGNGPTKAFCLFCLRHTQIVKMLLDICYKAVYNEILRTKIEKEQNRALMDKSEKLDGIVIAMKERGEKEEFIEEILDTVTPPEREIVKTVFRRLKLLRKAEIILNQTIFLLDLYLHHSDSTSGSIRSLNTIIK